MSIDRYVCEHGCCEDGDVRSAHDYWRDAEREEQIARAALERATRYRECGARIYAGGAECEACEGRGDDGGYPTLDGITAYGPCEACDGFGVTMPECQGPETE